MRPVIACRLAEVMSSLEARDPEAYAAELSGRTSSRRPRMAKQAVLLARYDNRSIAAAREQVRAPRPWLLCVSQRDAPTRQE